jgi:hypothetical protein
MKIAGLTAYLRSVELSGKRANRQKIGVAELTEVGELLVRRLQHLIRVGERKKVVMKKKRQTQDR